MRKLAPAFIVTSIIALASGSALAMGDLHKDKKAPKADTSTTSSTTAGTSANTPAPAASANPTTTSSNDTSAAATGTAMGSTAAYNGSSSSTASTSPSSTGTYHSGMAASGNDKQVARNDATRCDKSKYPNQANLPKDCKESSGTGAAH